MLRNLLDLVRAGAFSTALAIVQTGRGLAELTSALVARYGPQMAAQSQSVRALLNRATMAVSAAESYLTQQRPTAGQIPILPAPANESGVTTRVTIVLEELDSQGRPTGVIRYHTTFIDSASALTGQEITDLARDIAESMDINYQANIAFAQAVNRFNNYQITTRIDSVVRWA